MNTNDDQLTKLSDQLGEIFIMFSKRFDNIEQRMATKEDLNRVYDLLDKNISEHQRQEEERAAMSAQLDRHDVWIHQIADSTGTKLSQV